MTDASSPVRALAAHVAVAGVQSAPFNLISFLILVSKGLPAAATLMVMTYNAVLIARALWRWSIEIENRREVKKALRGDVPKHTKLTRPVEPRK